MNGTENRFAFERKLDEVGRIVVPKDIRNTLGWQPQERLVLTVVEGTLVVQRAGQ